MFPAQSSVEEEGFGFGVPEFYHTQFFRVKLLPHMMPTISFAVHAMLSILKGGKREFDEYEIVLIFRQNMEERHINYETMPLSTSYDM